MGHREKVFIDGKESASVTTILGIVRKEFLEKWRGKLGNVECDRIMHASQELGKNFHDAVECHYRGDNLPEMPAQVQTMFSLFREWAATSGFVPTELERYVESKKYLYHGTLDVIGYFPDGTLVMGDWKTSSAIDDLYGAQIAAYSKAFEEETGTVINDGFVLRVDKKPDAKKPLEIKRFTNLPAYFEVFLSCKDVYDFTKKRGKWAREAA